MAKYASDKNIVKIWSKIKDLFLAKQDLTKEKIVELGISDASDVYTKQDVYNKTETDSKFQDVYTKTETDSKFQTENQVKFLIDKLVNSAPETLDTLKELADALGNDPNFATTITNMIGNKANASDVYTKNEMDQLLDGNAAIVDTALSTTSTNSVQNRVITNALNGKANSSDVYNKTEADQLLDGKAASSHTHDDRYYTESEINTKLNAKANTSQLGTQVTYSLSGTTLTITTK